MTQGRCADVAVIIRMIPLRAWRVAGVIFRRFFRWLLLVEDYVVRMRRRTITRRTLAVIRMDAIGDFVLWLDAASALCAKYPRPAYRVTLIANTVWADLAESSGLFDDVIRLSRDNLTGSLLYRWKMLSSIRKRGFESVIHPTYSRDFLYSDAIVHVSGALERIGYSGDLSNMRLWQQQLSDRWYTRLIPASTQPRMELTRNADFVRSLGCVDFKANVPRLTVGQEPPRGHGAGSGKNYFVIFPGASWYGKRWPKECFVELSQRIHRATRWLVVVCGGNEDREHNGEIVSRLKIPTEDWTGRTSLEELAATLAHARLVVSNDTSAVHLAVATNCPVVCIVGGGHYGRFVPYETEIASPRAMPIPVTHKMDCFNCNWQCVYDVRANEAVPCIANVSVDDVWYAVELQLHAVMRAVE